MASIMRLSPLISAGLVVESAVEEEGTMVVHARSVAERRRCPLCGSFSGRVHSRYVRTIADLPRAGRTVRLRLKARRFLCEVTTCGRRIFAGRFEEGVLQNVAGGHHGSNVSFMISGWRWVAGRPPALPSD